MHSLKDPMQRRGPTLLNDTCGFRKERVHALFLHDLCTISEFFEKKKEKKLKNTSFDEIKCKIGAP